VDWNRVSKTPRIVTEGIYRTEIYTGGAAEVRLTEIKYRGHDTYDCATKEKIWYDFFVRLSRENYPPQTTTVKHTEWQHLIDTGFMGGIYGAE